MSLFRTLKMINVHFPHFLLSAFSVFFRIRLTAAGQQEPSIGQ